MTIIHGTLRVPNVIASQVWHISLYRVTVTLSDGLDDEAVGDDEDETWSAPEILHAGRHSLTHQVECLRVYRIVAEGLFCHARFQL